MKWANFLHVYQPAEQQPDILEAVVEQSYRPLFKYFRDTKGVRLTLNINGALLDLFEKYGHKDLIEMLREAGKKGHIEFTGSAKYHSFLPFLTSDEIERQISINDETCRRHLGDVYQPKGFFPPEMAYKSEMLPIIEKLGFKWIILDEIAYNGKPESVDYKKLYKAKGSKIHIFFRDRRISNLFTTALSRSVDTLADALKHDMAEDKYVVSGTDGEIFGHHRPGLELLFFKLLESPKFSFAKISDLLELNDDKKDKWKTVECSPMNSTWASNQRDMEKGIPYISWADSENSIHSVQKKFLDLAMDVFKKADKDDNKYEHARYLMDMATASDHFWWASAKPWWSVEMIEAGAYKLMEAIRAVPNISSKVLSDAGTFYENIISTAFNWQRIGKIRSMMKEQQSVIRIPFKDRTFGQGGEGEAVYQAFMDMMTGLEKKAVDNHEYEKAILWRDAKHKLEHKLDLYDTLHVVDLLRVYIPHEEVEETIKKYRDKYVYIRGGQAEQNGI